MPTPTIVLRDEAQLRACLDHFREPLDHLLAWVVEELAGHTPTEGAHFDFKCPRPVGLTGLKKLRPWDQSFWAPLKGRSLPSHLIVGHQRLTRWLSVRGFWKDDTTFILHALAPGRLAPREIHDPETDWSELGAAVAFWSRHAFFVAPGDWE
jgi:hypothetical protein